MDIATSTIDVMFATRSTLNVVDVQPNITMRKYQNTALKKISDFIEKNIDVIESAFGNLN